MIKRTFDIVLSFFGLVVLSPVLLLVALFIKLLMHGPVIYCQERVGMHGKLFTIYKFRTMIVNNSGSTVSVRGENRITPLGVKLRKYKLDELPELWNILIGEMSIVGPRPDVPDYLNKLVGEELHILDLRPGLTSPASIKYYNEEDLLASVPDPRKYYDEMIWPDKVRLNLEYYYKRSFFGDISIMFKTIFDRR